ncbi:MAG: polysaccharide biosynthesis protein [Clostridium sp.]|nr:polysaccharide biosynthesis protein [[Clostridium] innocuum]MCR0260938.1 polysaccharide biosynthesis protein [[Clostridium] innocuum]
MLDKIFANPLYKKYREWILCIMDLSIVLLSFFIAYWAKIDFDIRKISHIQIHELFIVLFTILVVYAVSFFIFKIHKSLWKYIGTIESVRISVSVLCASAVLSLIVFFTSIRGFYISVIFVAGILSILMMFNLRLAYRLLRHYSNRDRYRENIIIIGAGDAGYILLKEILQNNKMKVNVIGFVDDKRTNKMIAGYSVLGTTYDLPEIVQKYPVNLAYLAIPSATKSELRRINDICQAINLKIKIMKKADTLLEDMNESYFPICDISIEDLLGRGEIRLEQSEVNSYIAGKVITVTGAGGSIGSELCRQIVKFKPKALLMLDINENSLYMLEQEFNRDRMHGKLDTSIEIISLIVSIREYKSICDIFKEYLPDVVFHAAAHKHVPLMETRPQEAIKNNVFGTKNVLRACIKSRVSRFILISTDKAVNPTNVMGATKRLTEMLLQAYGKSGVTKMAAVRFGNVLGSNGSVIPIFKQQILEGGPITITNKNIVRYFMTIPEAAQLVLQAGYYADKGEIFILDMGEPVKILDLAEKMVQLSGLRPYEDIDIVEIGLRPGEKMFEELRIDGEVTVKTKNNLILKNTVMGITELEIEEKLSCLHNALNEQLSKEEYRDLILKLIKNEEREIV